VPGFTFPVRDRHGCTAGDINRDGRVDLHCGIGAGSGEGTKQDELWIAQPDGTYVNQVASWGLVDPYGRGRRSLMFDFNNDGLLDLYTTNLGFRADGQRSENILWVNHGDPATRGSGFVEQRVGATGSWGERCVADGDWNNDGRRDFLVCGPQTSVALHLFENQAGTDMIRSDGLLGPAVNSPRDATLADLNRDGWEDLLIVTTGQLQISSTRDARVATGSHRSTSACRWSMATRSPSATSPAMVTRTSTSCRAGTATTKTRPTCCWRARTGPRSRSPRPMSASATPPSSSPCSGENR
jgi:hypothetical protein